MERHGNLRNKRLTRGNGDPVSQGRASSNPKNYAWQGRSMWSGTCKKYLIVVSLRVLFSQLFVLTS